MKQKKPRHVIRIELLRTRARKRSEAAVAASLDLLDAHRARQRSAATKGAETDE